MEPITKEDFDLLDDAVHSQVERWRTTWAMFDYYGPRERPYATLEDGERFAEMLGKYLSLQAKFQRMRQVYEAWELLNEEGMGADLMLHKEANRRGDVLPHWPLKLVPSAKCSKERVRNGRQEFYTNKRRPD